MTDKLISALRRLGVTVVDLRGKLPTHATKTFGRRDPAALRGLVAHHSAGPTGGVDRFRAVASYHVGPNHISESGCPGICYSLGIAEGGEVCVFWDLEAATWSQGDRTQPGDENKEWLAVLAVGNFRSAGNPGGGEPSLEQLSSYLLLARACREVWGPGFAFTGHFAFGKPTCPGATLEAVARAIDEGTRREPTGTVLQVQAGLAALGYLPAGEVDGLDGPVTRAAVASFQRAQGLGVDGKAGPRTWAALVRAVDQHGERPTSW